jgi:hypothetical protein
MAPEAQRAGLGPGSEGLGRAHCPEAPAGGGGSGAGAADPSLPTRREAKAQTLCEDEGGLPMKPRGNGGAPKPWVCVFVCKSNSARSIAAECIAAGHARHSVDFRFFSAGTGRADGIKEPVQRALRRAGYSLDGFRSKSLQAGAPKPYTGLGPGCGTHGSEEGNWVVFLTLHAPGWRCTRRRSAGAHGGAAGCEHRLSRHHVLRGRGLCVCCARGVAESTHNL